MSSQNAIVIPNSPTLSIDSPLPRSMFSSSSSTPPPLTQPLSPTLSPLCGPPILISGKLWPGNMYVEDMVKGFMHMDVLKSANQGKFEARFEEVYRQDPPKVNTYHDQVRKWNLASQGTRNMALAAGRTQDGEWSRFARLSPLKKRI
jgi:hypothetical protein